MATIAERLHNKHNTTNNTQNNDDDIEEPTLTVNVDTSPNDEFREEQDQQEDVETQKIKELFTSALLDDETINSNKKKIFDNWSGDSYDINQLINVMGINETEHFVEKIIEKYSNKNDIKSFGNLTLKVILYAINPETIQEFAYIVNEIRIGYKTLWKQYIDKTIKTNKYIKHHIQKILQKNGISFRDSNKKELSIGKLKEILYDTFDIDMHVLQILPPSSARIHTSIRNEENNETNVENKENTNPTNPTNTQKLDVTEQIIEINKKNIEKYRKIMRSEMMKKLKEDKEELMKLREIVDEIQSNLEQEQLISSCEAFQALRDGIDNLLANVEREIQLWKAVPRTKSSRYVGRPEIILDLGKRNKQYNNEKKAIIKRIWEVATQTQSPMLCAMANGASYGVTKNSKGVLWCSKTMQMASMAHCVKFNELWNDFLQNKFAPQRVELQNNFQYILLKNKVKELISVAQQHKCEVIMDKLDDLNLGYLVQELNEENVEIIVETEEDENEEEQNEEDENDDVHMGQ
eukprot:287175_1